MTAPNPGRAAAQLPEQHAYFTRVNAGRFLATAHVGGGWNPDEQHIAPAFGLLAHALEDHINGELQLSRISYDILGVLPLAEVEIDVTTLRPGRSVRLMQARLIHNDRTAVIARAWFTQRYNTVNVAGSHISPIAGPETMDAWDPSTVWPGGFVHTLDVRRTQREPGRATVWLRTQTALIANKEVSTTARLLGLVDAANGMTPRTAPNEVAFPNIDLTVHLFREPRGDWIGCDTSVSFGASGLGVTESTLHDTYGPIGTAVQSLTVRPDPTGPVSS